MTEFQNKHCYEIKTLNYDDGIFNRGVDATYIIHLRNNGRYDSIMKQLNVVHPTNKVHLVYNDGFKVCEKTGLKQSTSVFDLVDAFLFAFHDAINKDYKSILILEDDFIFDKNIRKHASSVCEFVNEKKGESYVFSIGCIPFIMFPHNSTTYCGLATCGTHSMIYSLEWMKNIINRREHIDDWDVFHNTHIIKYVYHTPLCYQLFPDTENKKNWGNTNWLYIICSTFIKYAFWLVGLETHIYPGYAIFYLLSKVVILIVIILILSRYIPRKILIRI